MKRWIRLDADWSDSEWLFPLSYGARYAWSELLCYAKRSGLRGRVKAYAPVVFAGKLRMPTDAVLEMLDAASAHGALSVDGEEWVIVKWPEYQEPDSTSAERSKRYRESKSRLSPSRLQRRDGVASRDDTRDAVARDIDRDRTDASVISERIEITDDAGASPESPSVVETAQQTVMGAIRKLGYPCDSRDGSVVAAHLKKGATADELIRVAEGFALLVRDGRATGPLSLVPLNSKESKLWVWARQRYFEQEKRRGPRHGNSVGGTLREMLS